MMFRATKITVAKVSSKVTTAEKKISAGYKWSKSIKLSTNPIRSEVTPFKKTINKQPITTNKAQIKF